MNDDLTELLCNLATRFGRCRDQETVQKAVDEIERLRGREERLREAMEGVIRIADRDCPEFRAARAALEEEEK